jgi:hypothetical protein
MRVWVRVAWHIVGVKTDGVSGRRSSHPTHLQRIFLVYETLLKMAKDKQPTNDSGSKSNQKKRQLISATRRSSSTTAPQVSPSKATSSSAGLVHTGRGFLFQYLHSGYQPRHYGPSENDQQQHNQYLIISALEAALEIAANTDDLDVSKM